MTDINLKNVIKLYRDLLRSCPKCGSRRLIAEEILSRLTVFDIDNIENTKRYAYTSPRLNYIFKCCECSTLIYSKTIVVKQEKNYSQIIENMLKEMEYTRDRARLNYTRQSTIKESVSKNG